MADTTTTQEIEVIRPDKTGRNGHGGSLGGNGNHGADGGGNGDGMSSPGASARVPQRTYVTGMTVALGGILMFFMALVSAYIVRKGMPNSGWMPLPVFPRILWFNTAVLVASSFMLAHARRLLSVGDQSGFRHFWSLTTILGMFFLAGQVIAWRQLVHAGVYLATNPSSSFFYVFTAAHGLHLLGGIAALLSVLLLPMHKLTQSTATEVVAMYWHFMDGLWVFLFLLLILGR